MRQSLKFRWPVGGAPPDSTLDSTVALRVRHCGIVSTLHRIKVVLSIIEKLLTDGTFRRQLDALVRAHHF